MRNFFMATIVAIWLVGGCYTDQAAPKAALPSVAPSAAASAVPSSAPATPTPAPAASSSTEVGDMTSDVASHTIVIANFSAKAIHDPFPPSWNADKVFAGLGDKSVRSYVAGVPLEIVGAVGSGKGWSDAPQDEKYLGVLASGNLVTLLPAANSDANGSNIAFASKDGGSSWKPVGWLSSTGPKNYTSVFLFGEGQYALTKFKWADWKLTTK